MLRHPKSADREQAVHLRFTDCAFDGIVAGHELLVIDAIHHQFANVDVVALVVIGTLDTTKLYVGRDVGGDILIERQDEIAVGFLATKYFLGETAGGCVAVPYPGKVDYVNPGVGPEVGTGTQHQAQRRQDLVVQGYVSEQPVLLIAEGKFSP